MTITFRWPLRVLRNPHITSPHRGEKSGMRARLVQEFPKAAVEGSSFFDNKHKTLRIDLNYYAFNFTRTSLLTAPKFDLAPRNRFHGRILKHHTTEKKEQPTANSDLCFHFDSKKYQKWAESLPYQQADLIVAISRVQFGWRCPDTAYSSAGYGL